MPNARCSVGKVPHESRNRKASFNASKEVRPSSEALTSLVIRGCSHYPQTTDLEAPDPDLNLGRYLAPCAADVILDLSLVNQTPHSSIRYAFFEHFHTQLATSQADFHRTTASTSMRNCRVLPTYTRLCTTTLRTPSRPTRHCRPLGFRIPGNVAMTTSTQINGDLNNTQVLRSTAEIPVDRAYIGKTLAIPEEDDDHEIRSRYREGFLLNQSITKADWISKLELSTVLQLSEANLKQSDNDRLRVLVLYGSLRGRSYSRLLAYEASRILHRLGCDVRVYDPAGLPVKDDVQHDHPKVQELRELSKWSDGHVWVSPEQHGNLTAVFKNQIDWIPLSSGSVRPTQGRTLAIAQVSGGSQSFNTVNSLRMLGRWVRRCVISSKRL